MMAPNSPSLEYSQLQGHATGLGMRLRVWGAVVGGTGGQGLSYSPGRPRLPMAAFPWVDAPHYG